MEALQEVVKPNGHAPHNSVGDIGQLKDKLETFAFRLDEGKAPVQMKIRSFIMDGLEIDRIANEAVKLDAGHKELSLLISKRVDIEVETYSDINYDPAYPDARLIRIDKRIAELKKLQTADQYEAEYFFCRLIDSWEFTDEGEPVPITVDGVLSLSVRMRAKLKKDLVSFLSLENQGKRKV
jgi:hypothetical protein